MDIAAISASIGVQARVTPPNIERTVTRVIENRDVDGDKRLSPAELGNRADLFNRVDSNGDSFVNQEELFTALSRRLEERSDVSVQISLNINVIKANLGSLLSSIQGQSDSGGLVNLLNTDNIPAELSRSDTNARERYINAFITNDLDLGGFFNSSGTLSSSTDDINSLNPFTFQQNDGRELLLNLLVGELGTPRQDAVTIINILQSQSFETVA